jgi:tetrahydromethanopterin S-methyltransferase subunit B
MATLSAPADNEVFINVGSLNKRIADLEARLKELEQAAPPKTP